MFDPAQRRQLLQLARDSIAHGLTHGRPLDVDPADFPSPLTAPGASFVTLHLHAQLRGCIGSLEARRPLVQDVCENAYAAAFRDPRFAPLGDAEFELIQISLSVLGPSSPISFESEQDLLAQLRPGVDGLVLSSGHHRGTFLPSVWEQLPQPQEFLRHLKLKAGLTPDYWSDDLEVSRYHTESFAEAG